ncbi:MAG: phosphatase domain-containing protein [Alphaproteobacteria bacterium]
MASEFPTTADYLRASFEMLIIDHGIFRLAYKNFHAIGPQAFRSSQPAPFQVRQAARMGIRTIVNLRGPSPEGHYRLEKTACEKYGVKLVNFEVRSRALPPPETFHQIRKLFEKLDHPVLFHCKSGADRAGLMSALYLLIHLKRPLSQATAQLSLRYGHFRAAPTGVLDLFFETYAAHRQKTGQGFFEWIDSAYDPDAIKQKFRAGHFSRLLVNTILRRE